MSLAVVSYPELAEKDYIWIQKIRSKHDPQYKFINPHFTLVFPFAAENRTLFMQHIQETVARTPKIKFCITRTMSFNDTLSSLFYLFLIPELGSDSISELHSQLYDEKSKASLRQDVPFSPHITIGSSTRSDGIRNLEKELNKISIRIEGVLEYADVIEIDQKQTVRTLVRIKLLD